MSWTEEKSDVKFLCWGKIKPNLSKEEAYVVPMGGNIVGDVQRIGTQENDDGEINTYKYYLKVKDEVKLILIWSNSSILRQQKKLDIKEGEKVMFTYVNDYKTSYGKPGRNIKIAVDR